MDASTVATILGAVGFSGIAAATINFFANRKRGGADATKIITDAAASIVTSLRERVDELERREDERDDWEEEIREASVAHAQWDMDRIAELARFAPQLKIKPPPPMLPRKK